MNRRQPNKASTKFAQTGEWATVNLDAIAGHLLAKAGYYRVQAQTGGVTLIQRFGSALNLNVQLLCDLIGRTVELEVHS